MRRLSTVTIDVINCYKANRTVFLSFSKQKKYFFFCYIFNLKLQLNFLEHFVYYTFIEICIYYLQTNNFQHILVIFDTQRIILL